MPQKNIPHLPLAVALKKRAMTLDADLARQLRAADHLSPRLLHGTRVVTKRLRAWWQLMRPVAGRTPVRHAQQRLTAVAQMLAPVRDAHVMHQMLRRLSPRVKAGSLRTALEAVDRQLTATAAEGAAPAFPQLRNQLIRVLRSDAAAWRRLPVARTPDELIVAELARTYRRARRRGRRAARRNAARDLHAWRMWVKAYLHQMEFFTAERRRRRPEMIRQLARLGRWLGRGQDLAILDGWVDWRASTGALNRKAAGRVHTLLRRRQDEVRARCERLGRRLFAVKPKAFAAQLSGPSRPRAGQPRRRRPAAVRR
jgi:CHAD domain-containing protein